MSRLAVLLALLLATVLVAACGGDDEGDGKAAAEETPAPAQSETGCETVEEPAPKEQPDLKRPKEELERSKRYVAKVDTSCGQFEIRLDPRQAPKTGGSFAYLAREGFYDGLTFHRVVQGFVIQGGDPKGDGTGGPGYSVVEAPPKDLTYARGVVAMAKTDIEKRGTSGSQFFVVTEDADLPPDYALVGKVTKGMDIVDRIAVVPTDQQNDRPIDPVVIRRIEIEER